MYEIKSEDVYEELFKCKHLFDLRANKSKFFDPTNKKVFGKRKDEFKGTIACKFAGLKPKMYLIATENKKINKGKGINVPIEFKECRDVLINKK